MLNRIHIRGFKSLLDVEVRLRPLVVLFGPNAAGKSNFLEALLLLSRMGTERTIVDAFDGLRGFPQEAFSLPRGGLPGLLKQPEARLLIEADLSSEAESRRVVALRYRVGVEATPKTGALALVVEYLARLNARGEPAPRPRIERVSEHVVVLRGAKGQRREEPAGRTHTLASSLQFGGEEFPELEVLRLELAAWRTYYLDPLVAMRQSQPPRQVTDIGPRGELLAPFLYRLKTTPEYAPRFDAVSRALHRAIPAVDRLDVEPDQARGTLELVIVQGGGVYSSRVVSEGTLRVLALCAMAASPWPGALVAFEEPENGVQPRRIEVIADLLLTMSQEPAGRQVVVATHSPTLLAALAQRKLENPDGICLLSCASEGRETVLRRLDPRPLFADEEIVKALAGSEGEFLFEAMLLRGWLDG